MMFRALHDLHRLDLTRLTNTPQSKQCGRGIGGWTALIAAILRARASLSCHWALVVQEVQERLLGRIGRPQLGHGFLASATK
jgi:hypothetical protein